MTGKGVGCINVMCISCQLGDCVDVCSRHTCGARTPFPGWYAPVRAPQSSSTPQGSFHRDAYSTWNLVQTDLPSATPQCNGMVENVPTPMGCQYQYETQTVGVLGSSAREQLIEKHYNQHPKAQSVACFRETELTPSHSHRTHKNLTLT